MQLKNLNLAFISMPQAITASPSIGLTQLKAVINNIYPGRLNTRIIYAHLDFISSIGIKDYKKLEEGNLTEWLFRGHAFPEAADNSSIFKEYVLAGQPTNYKMELFNLLLEFRKGIGDFLEGLIEKYLLLDCDLIGFTSVVYQNIASFALARLIKQKNPDCIVVMGGANCDYPMGKEIIDHIDAVDYVFAGPGIISWTKFMDGVLNGTANDLHQINGVFSKKNNIRTPDGVVLANSPEKPEYTVNFIGDYHDLGILADPGNELDYNDFLEQYEQFRNKTGFPHQPMLLFETGRGCWKRDRLPCNFCGLNDPQTCFGCMKPEAAVDYLNKHISRYADRCSVFFCTDNIIAKNYFQEVLPALKIPSHIVLLYETSAHLSQAEMETAVSCGAKMLQPGIESLNSGELRLMQKGTTAFTSIMFLKKCIETGTYPTWNLLCGVPGVDTAESFLKIIHDIPVLRHLPPPAGYIPIVFCRFSPYFDRAEKFGLRLKPIDSYFYLYPFEAKVIAQLAYFFEDSSETAAYKKMVETYFPRVTQEVVVWLSMFRGFVDFPKLYFLNETTIYDSRTDPDEPQILEITPDERSVLRFLEIPRALKDLEANFSGDIALVLENLHQNNLLFNEEDRVMSLVCKKVAWNKSDYEKLVNMIALSISSAY
jgi:ribosomal peptide maturation radical SAM protein 1